MAHLTGISGKLPSIAVQFVPPSLVIHTLFIPKLEKATMILFSSVPNSILLILALDICIEAPMILTYVGVVLALVAFIRLGKTPLPPPPKNTLLLVKGDTFTADTVPLFKPIVTDVNVLPV